MKTFKHTRLLAGVDGIAIFGLAACGSKVLDYRNAQISNGKIFAGDDNNPFSAVNGRSGFLPQPLLDH